MLLRSSIIAGAAMLALVGFAQAAADMPSAQTTTAPAPTTTAAPPPADAMTPAPAPVAGIKLDAVQNPKQTLRGAAVKDSKGDAVGEVKSVQLDAAGKVAAVNISLGSKTVALKAETLTFVQAENTLISSQSKAEIEAK